MYVMVDLMGKGLRELPWPAAESNKYKMKKKMLTTVGFKLAVLGFVKPLAVTKGCELELSTSKETLKFSMGHF